MKGPIALGTLRTSMALGLRLVVQAGTLLLIARMLGPDQFGAFAGVASLAVLLGTLSTFGTHLVLLGEVSKEPARREQVLPYAIPTTLGCGSVALVLYLMVCTFVLDEAGIAIPVLLLIGITETLLQPLFGLMASEHHALGRIARAQLLQLLPLGLRLMAAGTVFALDLHHPLTVYAAGYTAASVVALVFGASKLPARWPSWHHWRLPYRREWTEAFGYAAINITKAGPAELDKTLALKLLPLEAAGVYAAGARIVGAITLPITAMTLSALPRLFREGQSPSQSTRQLLWWMYGAALGYSVVLASAMWLAAPVLGTIFGPQYQGMDEVIRWLCIAIPGMALRLVAGNALMALGKPWMRVGFEFFGLLLLITTSIIFTKNNILTGMPIAISITEWTIAATGLIFIFLRKNKNSQI